MAERAPLEPGEFPTTLADAATPRRYALNLADATAAIARSLGGRVLRDERFALADADRPAGFASSGLLLEPVPPGDAETIAAVAGFYGFADGRDRSGVSLFNPWPTPDLRPHGWRPVAHPSLHLLPTGATPPPPPPPELRIERVADEEALARWERTAVAAYPFRDLRGFGRGSLLGGAVLADDRHCLWIGRVEEADVAVGQAFVAHGLTNVLMVATLRHARRNGYGTAMTWAAVTTEPDLPTMLLSSEDGRPVYDRMGFLPLSRWTLWYRYG